jgi:hypothetical protein
MRIKKNKIRLAWSGGFIAETEAVSVVRGGGWLHGLKTSQPRTLFYKGVACVRRNGANARS